MYFRTIPTQLSRHRSDNLFSIFSWLLFQSFKINTISYFPIQGNNSSTENFTYRYSSLIDNTLHSSIQPFEVVVVDGNDGEFMHCVFENLQHCFYRIYFFNRIYFIFLAVDQFKKMSSRKSFIKNPNTNTIKNSFANGKIKIFIH